MNSGCINLADDHDVPTRRGLTRPEYPKNIFVSWHQIFEIPDHWQPDISERFIRKGDHSKTRIRVLSSVLATNNKNSYIYVRSHVTGHGGE